MTSGFESRLGTFPEEGIKAPCKAATTADTTLTGEQTIDGTTLVAGDRCLVWQQTDNTENGIYDVQVSEWTRSTDFNEGQDVASGILVVVDGGDTVWQTSFTGDYDPGVTAMTFTQMLDFGASQAAQIAAEAAQTAAELAETNAAASASAASTSEGNASTSETNAAASASAASTSEGNASTSEGNAAASASSAAASAASVVNQLPAGILGSWPVDTPPQGWFIRNGQSLATADFPELFAVLGYKYGGSGASFNVPDARGEFPRYSDMGRGLDPDWAGNDRDASADGNFTTGSTQSDAFKDHTHASGDSFQADGSGAGVNVRSQNEAGLTGSTGGDETRPTNIAELPIIYAGRDTV